MRDDKSRKRECVILPHPHSTTTVNMSNQVTPTPGSQIVTVNQAGQVISIVPVQQQQQHHHQQQQQQMILVNPPSQPFVQYLPMQTAFPAQQIGGQIQCQVVQTPNGPQIVQTSMPTTLNPMLLQQQQQQHLQLMQHQHQILHQQQQDADEKNHQQTVNNLHSQMIPQQIVQCTQIIRQPPQVIVNPMTGQVIGHVGPQQPFAFNPMISQQVMQSPHIVQNGTTTLVYQQHPLQQLSPQGRISAVQVSPQLPRNVIQVTQPTEPIPPIQGQALSKEAIRIQEIMKQEAEKIALQKQSQPHANGKHSNKISTRLKQECLNSSLPTVSSTTPTKKVETSESYPDNSVETDVNLPSSPEEGAFFLDRDHASPTSVTEDMEGNEKDASHGEEEDNCRTCPSSSPSSRMEPESTTQHDLNCQNTVASAISTNVQVADGVNLAEVMKFARTFKSKRLQLGLTQTQVGASLSQSQGPSYSQSAICRFEKLEITPRSALKIMPILSEWLAETEKKYANGQLLAADVVGFESGKKRRKRTTFSTEEQEALLRYFEVTMHPSSYQMAELANQIGRDREVVRVWFCNRRQALKKELDKKKMIMTLKDAEEAASSHDNQQNENNSCDNNSQQAFSETEEIGPTRALRCDS